ncbi:hydrogenase large subunit [Rhodopila globiformis]|uniref:Hydrogenase expression protein HypE n=1 Tax=Rhodopila globiformis TaxID=1071 RepID=A0A2S6N711_RHOGL|nr:NADH-quinone oxidoreductase subunit C [Rhodopila globiformis]PPQ30393.1 hydrogenase expression protein HypE [Rhodopila globiformis]
MSLLTDLIAGREQVIDHRPWPRVLADRGLWRDAAERLADGGLSLLSEWGEPGWVHMAVLDTAASPPVAVLSLACPDGRFPSVGAVHPAAIRLERAIRDLFGLAPEGLPDTRPWLDHGRWGDAQEPAASYPFLPASGEGLHQIPVGPVHAGIIEPGHFRFTCDGETIVRLEQRLGYVHKGVDLLMTGAPVARAARLAGHVCGDSTVAYALAFARAVEAATGTTPPERAVWLRAVMAELERLANHIGDFGAICNDGGFAIMLAHCGILRETVLRNAAECFGHRLMMDRIVPGGVAGDLRPVDVTHLQALLRRLREAVPRLVRLYDDTPSLQDRTVTTGILNPVLAKQFAAGGYVGRASGRSFDARRDLAYAPYDVLSFAVPVLQEGDVNARVWIRLKEIDASLILLDHLLREMPEGPVAAPLRDVAVGEGMAVAEAFRGDVLVWLRIANGVIERCHLRDASWFQWPLLEAAIEGNIVADFPICNKSFNCSYSGHDL